MYLLLLLGIRDILTIGVIAILIACASPRRPGWRESVRYIVLTPITALLLAFGIHIGLILATQALEAARLTNVAQAPITAPSPAPEPSSTPCMQWQARCGNPEIGV